MAYQVVSTNLNLWGDSGNFETDPSTWNITPAGGTLSRDINVRSKGLYALKFTANVNSFPLGYLAIARAKATFALGKKYKAIAKVRTSSTSTLCPDSCIITLSDFALFDLTPRGTYTTVGGAKDNWFQLEWYFNFSIFTSEIVVGVVQVAGAAVNVGAPVWVDEFEIYEVIEVADPDPGDPDPGDPDPEPEAVNTFFSGNVVALTIPATDALLGQINYRVRNDVLLEKVTGSGTFVQVFSSQIPPDQNNKCVFYIDPAFRGLLTAIPPTRNQDNIVRLTDRIKYFKTRYGDLYDGVSSPATFRETDIACVLLGGVSADKFPGLNFFSSYLPNKKRFLTWQPNSKEVDRGQEDYLFFYVFSDTVKTIAQSTKVYFDDGTTLTHISSAVPVVFRGLMQLPAGPSNLGIDSFDVTKNVVRYETWLKDGNGQDISEVRKYIVTEFTIPGTRYLLFLNSLGGFDTIRTTGQKMEQTSFDRTVVQKFLPHDYQALEGQLATNACTYQDTFQYSTGFFKKGSGEWLEYMKELFNSKQVYDITEGLRVPIVIQSDKLPGRADKVYERFAQFDAVSAYVNKYFTPDII